MTDKETLQPTKQPKLTHKQALFIDYYIETLNATEAYMQAFSPRTRKTAQVEGSKLLSNPIINIQIEKRMEEIREPIIASAQEVLTFLTDMMHNKKAKDTDRIKSAELLGRRYALFTERIDLNQSVEVEINLLPNDRPYSNDGETLDIEFEEVD